MKLFLTNDIIVIVYTSLQVVIYTRIFKIFFFKLLVKDKFINFLFLIEIIIFLICINDKMELWYRLNLKYNIFFIKLFII